MMTDFKNDREALIHALKLAVYAPKDKLEDIVKIADEIANRLGDKVVNECKDEVVAWIDAQEELKNNQNTTIH